MNIFEKKYLGGSREAKRMVGLAAGRLGCETKRGLMAFWGSILIFCFCFSSVAEAEISFTPHFTTGFEYTDNVDLDPANEENDFLLFLNPGIDLGLTGRHGGVELSYNPTYTVYTLLPENNSLSHSAGFGAWLDVVRDTRIELGNSFTKTNDPISETDTTIRRGRESHYSDTATIALVTNFSDENIVDVHYAYSILENEDEAIEDSSSHMPGVLFTYWLSPNRYALEMEGTYTLSDFESSENFEEMDARIRLTKRFSRHFDWYLDYSHLSTDFLGDGDDYVVHNPSVGFVWAELSDTQLSASFGYFYRDSKAGNSDNGLVGSVEMSYDWSEGSSFSFTGETGFEQAYFRAENLGFNPYTRFSGSFTKQLSQRMAGNLRAGYRRSLYLDEDPDREDITTSGGWGLTFQALPWLTCGLNYEFRKVSSSIVEYEYTENRGGITVTLQPRQALRF